MSRAILGVYIAKQTVPWLLIGLIGASFVFLTTQLIRIAPVFAGAEVGLLRIVEGIGLLLVPVLGWALAPAYLVALFAVAGTMSETGERLALDALGIPLSARLWPSAILSASLAALCAWIWLDAAPRAGGRIFDLAADLAETALIDRIAANQVTEPLPGLTFYAEAVPNPGRFETVFAAYDDGSGPEKQITAERATLTREKSGMLVVRFESGHLFLQPRNGKGGASADGMPHTAVTFESLRISLPMLAAVTTRLNFIPKHLLTNTSRLLGAPPPEVDGRSWRYTLWRRIATPIGFLLLSIAGMTIAFGTRWRSRGRAVLVAAVLFALYQAAGRAGESLMLNGALSPAAAALLPAGAVILFFAGYFGACRHAPSPKDPNPTP